MTDGHLRLETAARLRYPAYLAMADWAKVERGLPVTRGDMLLYIRRMRWLERFARNHADDRD